MGNDEETRSSHRSASVYDMDGTLLRTDVFVESLVRVALRRPWVVMALPWWLLRGRGYCKGRVAKAAAGLWTNWPVRDSVVRHVAASRNAGDTIVLATAAHESVASAVARDVGLFDVVLASTDAVNLKGRNKVEAIQAWVRKSGHAGFSYAGDSPADVPVWSCADRVIAVSPTRRVQRVLRRMGKPIEILDGDVGGVRALVAALRPHQWAKNVLLFVPMLAAHRFDMPTVVATCLGFIAFSMVASAVYVLNDLADLDSDRKHPIKRGRPFASGSVAITTGIVMVSVLLAVGMMLAWGCLPSAFAAVLAGYFVANVGYSAFLKQRPIIDVLMLAMMYGLRIEAGGLAGDIQLSQWLLAFSLFLFTSLAFAKRYAELRRVESDGGRTAAGRGYVVADCETLLALGSASGYVAVLVLALYMNSEQMRTLYGEGKVLWLLCPLMMYWITRVWLVARRGGLNEDPLVFALRDRGSIAVVVAGCVLVAMASLAR